MPVSLPSIGQTNWGDKLNTAILALSSTLDAHSAALATQPVAVQDATDFLGLAVTTFQAGPDCGVTFAAPASGKVFVTVAGHMESNTAAESCYLSFEIRNGSTIGSGTVFFAAVTDYGIGVGGNAGARVCGSRRKLISGLTPGVSYNARTMHICTGGTFDLFARELLVEPVKTA